MVGNGTAITITFFDDFHLQLESNSVAVVNDCNPRMELACSNDLVKMPDFR